MARRNYDDDDIDFMDEYNAPRKRELIVSDCCHSENIQLVYGGHVWCNDCDKECNAIGLEE